MMVPSTVSRRSKGRSYTVQDHPLAGYVRIGRKRGEIALQSVD